MSDGERGAKQSIWRWVGPVVILLLIGVGLASGAAWIWHSRPQPTPIPSSSAQFNSLDAAISACAVGRGETAVGPAGDLGLARHLKGGIAVTLRTGQRCLMVYVDGGWTDQLAPSPQRT